MRNGLRPTNFSVILEYFSTLLLYWLFYVVSCNFVHECLIRVFWFKVRVHESERNFLLKALTFILIMNK